MRHSKAWLLMSALGQKQTSAHVRVMSALPPKADIGTGPRFTFDAATPAAWRFSPQSAAPHHRLIIWKMGTKNYKQKTTEGIRSADYYLVVEKCSPRTQTKIMAFRSLFV